MTIGGITNPPSVQVNLAALANSTQQLQSAEQQLSTGKSVNSPNDNPTAFFASQAFLQQASDLSSLKDNLSTSLTTLNSTTSSISSVSQVVQQLQGITAQAAATTDPTLRAGLASQFNALLPQLDSLVNDSTFNGTNLLNNTSNSLTVNFNPSNTSSLTVSGANVTSSGLNISQASNNFASNADIAAANSQLSSALSTLNTAAANFGGNATLIQTRQQFTSDLTNNLLTASDNLTAADTNQTAADIQAAQAQNQLGIVSLSISGQLAQSVLKLFQ
jgi:flagellin